MKPVLVVSLLCSLVAFGCAKKTSSSEATTGSAENSSAASPKAVQGPRALQITAGDNMKFSLTQIEAKPDEELTVTLQNVGAMPKEVMAHNFILLKAGSDPQAYANAAVLAKATDYMPAALNEQVIAHTKLLGAKQSDTITFKAPSAPGEYPFLCSFPAHCAFGMKGVLVVK